MRLWNLSDLHLEFSPLKTRLGIPDADVCMVEGDVHSRGPDRSVKWLGEHVCPLMPVVFVCGNHEFYRRSMVEGPHKGREVAAATPNMHFLEDDSVLIGDVAVWGATLWTDFELIGSRKFAMEYAEQVMNDYGESHTRKAICAPAGGSAASTHRWSVHSLSEFFDRNRGRKTLVVSHHAPTRSSIAPQHAMDITSAAFASDLDELIVERGPGLWIHGHVHRRFDYLVGATRTLCNPRVYPDEKSFAQFDFQLTVRR